MFHNLTVSELKVHFTYLVFVCGYRFPRQCDMSSPSNLSMNCFTSCRKAFDTQTKMKKLLITMQSVVNENQEIL